jgi:5'-nucleotidase
VRILITNDDGIHSEGIKELIREFEADGGGNSNVNSNDDGNINGNSSNEIIVVAPDMQRSAAGHSITINRPIIVREQSIEGIRSKAYSIDGTPADCVKLGVDKICNKNIDMIISGINCGTNLGSDVIYSGTVSAAIEGAVCKIPSFAVSLDVNGEGFDYKVAARFAKQIIMQAMKKNIKEDIVLNINIPALPENQIKGIRVSELGNRIYQNSYLETKLENSEIGYKIEGFPKDEDGINTDTYNLKQGYVTVTPLHYDLTNYKILKKVNDWFEEGK